MTCEKVRQLLSDYLDGELSPAVTEGVQSHLYRCSHCERELQALRRTVQLLAVYGRQRVPVDCRGPVLARLRAGEEARRVSPWGWCRLLPKLAPLPTAPGWARASAAAAVVLALVVGTFLVRSGPTAGVERPSWVANARQNLAELAGTSRASDAELTSRESFTRFHAPSQFGQAMGRDDGIVLVSDWVEAP